ncbi:phytoene desaturase family protein [Nocardioides marmotae]|uniref:Pyridine nucleotide-disulfide oxidoreductase domain-containing protein 2 n=1 Tax=Nocardioides marmotae TaxID=2663857 RepID=A0A6I3JFA3_9ACTN|nr:NAD(P)/FAD-dependent oxidoreductase [Nocardioides marmotae]MCR6033107.1 NAD(P)-binding protein [Gordonia jinghuaiqii]MBC9732608.1 NAD(P)/FAD-dependent oxidoreductase [Nocardioides marmotae]MTB83726.1 NAD(P)-binding protein [Nocardioides marmotae]MTB96759.1 NAD(P)-binding protein [Nocardioides marmotae]QKE03032.1 NAD(P)/FAD-dependent oxidoreductase [Nocardioides marmotae]
MSSDPRPEPAEVVVVGAGHNSLVAAAYLARAGLDVLVLEAEEAVGGNTRTEELTLPGFAHDSCSSAHVLIQNNPLIRDDELGLLSDHGLEYVATDPAVVLPQADGELLVMHRDLSATAAELARWSSADARAFEQMIGAWRGGLAAAHGRWSSGLPQPDDETTRSYRALRRRSGWEVVHETFSHPVTRSFMLWLAMATIQDPRRPGTGFLPSSLAAGRLDAGWTTPVGGSQALPDALVRVITGRGGRVVCGTPVVGVLTDGDRATGVRLASGATVRASRAVVTGGHLRGLSGMLEGRAPTGDLDRARDSWRPGLSVLAVHAALRDDLRFGPSGITSAAAGLGTTGGIVAHLDRFAAGEWDAEDPWLLAVNQTTVDPSRRPASGGGTFKILTIAPYSLAGGRSWSQEKDEYGARLVDLVRRHCTGLAPADILSVRTESPPDVAAHNPQNVGGSCHGGEFVLDGEVVSGWPRYDTDVPGLFLTGACVHPGGSVSGRPGRNAARAVLTALALDPGTVMGPT